MLPPGDPNRKAKKVAEEFARNQLINRYSIPPDSTGVGYTLLGPPAQRMLERYYQNFNSTGVIPDTNQIREFIKNLPVGTGETPLKFGVVDYSTKKDFIPYFIKKYGIRVE